MTSKEILNNFQSPATGYEITLTELSKSKNSKDEKILKVFEILDEIVPKLGVYARIMKIVRKQLFDAVYSDDFTGGDQKTDESIQRISYYSKLKILMGKKDEKYQALRTEINQKDTLLQEKDEEMNDFKQKIDDLNKNIANLNRNASTLNNEIKEKREEIENFEVEMNNIEHLYDQKVNILENKIEDLSAQLSEGSNVISDLSNYKNSYDNIHNTFSPAYTSNEQSTEKSKVHASRKVQITVDILNAKKLEEQIVTLINIATEEYDMFLEKQNEYLLEKFKNSEFNDESYTSSFNNMSKNGDTARTFLTYAEKNMLNKQLEKEKINYHKSILDLKDQYDLTVQHRQSLEEKLYLLEADRETSEFMKRQKAKAAQNQKSQTNSTSSLQGLEEHYEPIRKGADKDQFAVQDRIFSRWSCTMMTSINGNVWYECSNVSICKNCGDKTLVCPHKVSLNDTVIKIPEHTAFLKFTRPRLQYNQFMIKRSLDAYKKIDPKFQANSNSIVLTNYKSQFPQDLARYQNRDSLNILIEGNAEIGMLHNFQRVWYDFSQRTSYKRQVARPFTYDRTISIVQQFLAYLHNKELNIEHNPKDIVNTLYEYFGYRYELEDIKYAAIFDFYSSINVYAAKSMLIEIFCNVLIGNLDRSVINYLLYMAEIIDRVEWAESDDVKIFFAIIYPYLDEDELDTLNLEFTSFSENKINKKLVLEFIMTQIMKRKEVIINEMEFRLSTRDTLDKDFMNEYEFCKSMEEFFLVADEKHSMISYRTSLAHAAWDNLDVVPVSKLAQTAAYFCLIQLMNDMTESISKIIDESRAQVKKKEMEQGLAMQKSNQKTEFVGEFIKISEIDELAQAILK